MAEPKPDTLNYEKRADGVQVAFLKPPLYRRSRKLFAQTIVFSIIFTGFCVGVAAVAMSIGGKQAAPFLLLPLFVQAVSIAVICQEINWERDEVVIDVGNGLLTLVRSSMNLPKQWSVSDIQTVRAWAWGTTWELRIELKSGEVLRFLKGRSRVELQRAASLLRDALGRGNAPSTPTAAAAVTFIEGGECQICGANMTDHVVFCAKCRTPHHEECWTYNGACSTYGCREIRFTRAA